MHWTFNTCMIKSVSGRVGDEVYVFRKGKQHVRPYVKQGNPDTPAQRVLRGVFAGAITTWQSLSAREKGQWSARARRMRRTGYNLFISDYLRATRIKPVHVKTKRGNLFRVRRRVDENQSARPRCVVIHVVFPTGNPNNANRASPGKRVA